VTVRTDNAAREDRVLLVRARHGDERAFGCLFEHHRRGLAVLCHLMLGDPVTAKLVMTEAAITAWRERDAVDPSLTVRVWLYRIALRLCQAADPSAMSSDVAGRLTW
jgi:DNA-directed RNA polymerase specialized sigma24 family protein